MARIIGFLLFLAVMAYVIVATWLFVVALVITVAVVRHVRGRHRVAQRAAMAAKLHRPPTRHPLPHPAPMAAPASAYLRRWSVQRRRYVAGDKDAWDMAFRDAELRAQGCPAGPGAYVK